MLVALKCGIIINKTYIGVEYWHEHRSHLVCVANTKTSFVTRIVPISCFSNSGQRIGCVKSFPRWSNMTVNRRRHRLFCCAYAIEKRRVENSIGGVTHRIRRRRRTTVPGRAACRGQRAPVRRTRYWAWSRRAHTVNTRELDSRELGTWELDTRELVGESNGRGYWHRNGQHKIQRNNYFDLNPNCNLNPSHTTDCMVWVLYFSLKWPQ